jgi:hypothetical protein
MMQFVKKLSIQNIDVMIRPHLQAREKNGEYVLYEIEICQGGLVLNPVFIVIDGFGRVKKPTFIDFLFTFREKSVEEYKQENKPLPLYSYTYVSNVNGHKFYKHITSSQKKFYYPLPLIIRRKFNDEDLIMISYFHDLKQLYPYKQSSLLSPKRVQKVLNKILANS